MNKISYFISVLLFVSINSSAQSLIDTNKIWTVPDNFGTCSIFFFDGDTLFNNITYKKLYTASDSTLLGRYYNAALREDTNKRIFVYNIPNEYLLYDFSLKAGDSVLVSWPSSLMYVYSVDTLVLLNGETRRRLLMVNSFQEYWIEGIGSSNGLMNVDFYNHASDIYVELNCFFENDTLKYHGLPNLYCYSGLAGINKISSYNTYTIHPNPFTEYTFLEFGSPLKDGKLKIFDCKGNLVETVSNVSGKNLKIDRGELKSGLYFFSITDKSGIIRGKLLIM